MGLIQVEHIGVEQSACGVELGADSLGIGPQRLGGHEELVAAGGEMRPDRRLGVAVLGRDVEVIDPSGQGGVKPDACLLGAGREAGRATQDGHAALVVGTAEASALHRA